MWLLREKLSDFGVKQILYRVDKALYVHPKNSLRSHLRAIMALDHSRSQLWKTYSWKKIRPNFLRTTSLQILANKSGCVQTILFFFFIHHIWGEKVLWGAVFIIQTSYKMQYSTIFQDKLHSFNTQDHRSTRGLLISETVQKVSKINYTASQF